MRILATILLAWIPAFAGMTGEAADPVVHEITPGVVVVGWDRLGATARTELQRLLHRVPRGLYASLREIHIDGDGFDPGAMDQINCWSTGAVYAVCAHELGHQMDVTAPGWLHDWARTLIAEAGCEPSAYVRAMLPPCFFRDYPQEFVASMVGEYLLDSAPMWARALDAAGRSELRPLDQMVLLTVLFHVGGDPWVTVLAYEGGDPVLWVASPWRCGGPSTISGPEFAATITTDEQCHVVAVTNRRGVS